LFSKVKTLGTEDSDDDDSAMSWVAKSRKKEQEKCLAEKRVSWCSPQKIKCYIHHYICGLIFIRQQWRW